MIWGIMGLSFLSLLIAIKKNLLATKVETRKGSQEYGPERTFLRNISFRRLFIDILMIGVQPYPFFKEKRVQFYHDDIGEVIFYHVNELIAIISLMKIIYFGLELAKTFSFSSASARRIS